MSLVSKSALEAAKYSREEITSRVWRSFANVFAMADNSMSQIQRATDRYGMRANFELSEIGKDPIGDLIAGWRLL